MENPLATYLHDHLAGSTIAVDLLESLRDQHGSDPLGRFAADILAEVEEDREVLRGVADRVGGSRSNPLKEAVAWMGEKATRVKLHRQTAGELGTLQALETLALGILGKEALWTALATIAPLDERVRGPEYDVLAASARTQHARVERRRIDAAGRALSGLPD